MCMSLHLMILNLKFMASLKLINSQLQHEFSTVFTNLRSCEISKLF